MIIFEYTKLIRITSLVNHEPFIWKWVNPNINVAPWWYEVFGMSHTVSSFNKINVVGSRLNGKNTLLAEDYATMKETPESIYWDHDEQVAYVHLLTNPIFYTSIYLALLQGATDEDTIVMNDVIYPGILLSRPNIHRSVEPVDYGKISTQNITVTLQNMEMFTVLEDKIINYWLFDDLVNSEETIAGQTTYLKIKNGEDIRTVHKGVVSDFKLNTEELTLTCADRRSKTDAEWPTETYRDLGLFGVKEDELDKVIPDGFGLSREIPLVCINRPDILFEVDDDNELILPTDQRLNWNVGAWSKTGVIVEKLDSNKIGKFDSYRIEKSSASGSSRVYSTFTAKNTKHKVVGYIRCEEELHAPVGDTKIEINGSYITLKLSTQTSNLNGHTGRVKYNISDDGKITAYFSFETEGFVPESSYTISVYPDTSSQNLSAIAVSAIRVSEPIYPKFKIAKEVTELDRLFYEEDDEQVELKNIISLNEGIIELHEVDVHKEGIITNGLVSLYCDAILRPETNPMDVIVKLNELVFGYLYIPGLYNIEKCDEEKVKLGDIALYKEEPEKFYNILEEIQAGSTVGFRYDDVDKIYIYCDDPNRKVSFNIIAGQIVNELECDANLTLYADEVTVEYLPSRKDNDVLRHINKEYQEDVLITYGYKNPRTIQSLVTNEEDAINQSTILLEDLSKTKPIYEVELEGLWDVDLYDIGTVDLRLEDRPFAGKLRMQVIGIELDTEFNMTKLKLRERNYSDAFATITGSYKALLLLGQDEVAIGYEEDETEFGIVIGGNK